MSVPLPFFVSAEYLTAWLAVTRVTTFARMGNARCEVPVLPRELKHIILKFAFQSTFYLKTILRDHIINTDEEEDRARVVLKSEDYFIVKPGNFATFTRATGIKGIIFDGYTGLCYKDTFMEIPVLLLLLASYVHPEDEVSFSQALNVEYWRCQSRGICYKTFDTFRKFTVFIVVFNFFGYDYADYVQNAPHLTPLQKEYLIALHV